MKVTRFAAARQCFEKKGTTKCAAESIMYKSLKLVVVYSIKQL